MTPELEEARQREAVGLDSEILEAIGRGWDDPLDESGFDVLARAVFAHQFRFNPVYRQFCLLQGISAPADVGEWRQIPLVPTGAFKVGRWATFPPELTDHTRVHARFLDVGRAAKETEAAVA